MVLKHYEVKKYDKSYYDIWNQFVTDSKNGTFLFHRDFMEYHSDRFEDYSLLVFDEKNKLVAILPANREDDELYSHKGLSYGGILVSEDIRIKEYVLIFKSILKFLNDKQINQFSLKMIPKIYNKTISEEIDYVAFLTNAKVFRSDVYLVVDNNDEYKPNRNRKRALVLAQKLNIEIKEDNNYEGFWNQVLIPNLLNRFGVHPVHSVEEIERLAKLFPENIILFNAYQDNELKAGVVMFLTDTTSHFQYSSGGEDRNDTAALDLLFDFILKKYSEKRYCSFGSSSEQEGRKLNEGLAYWKESFGAKTAVQNFIKFQTESYKNIDI